MPYIQIHLHRFKAPHLRGTSCKGVPTKACSKCGQRVSSTDCIMDATKIPVWDPSHLSLPETLPEALLTLIGHASLTSRNPAPLQTI